MHDDVTRLKVSMVVVVKLKFKMAAGSTSSGGNRKSTGSMIYPKKKKKKKIETPEPLINRPATSEHMSALLPFKFPASGKYDAILNSCVTPTTKMPFELQKHCHYQGPRSRFSSVCVCGGGLTRTRKREKTRGPGTCFPSGKFHIKVF